MGPVKLTPIQRWIFQQLIAGKRPKEIYKQRQTCHQLCARVKKKLGAKTTLQAAVMLVRQGVL